MNKYIFTITTGRSAQASFSKILSESIENSYISLEGPRINPLFDGFLGDMEKKFRRSFVETHELLGRGKILTSYSRGDYYYIDRIVKKKLRLINRFMDRNNKTIYIDVSKYFSRGMHCSYIKTISKLSLIHLVRDPIANMRSFVNRGKVFTLDNNLPDDQSNIFTLDSSDLTKNEFYFWSWIETYLRYEKFKKFKNIENFVEIRSEKIDDSSYISSKLDNLEIKHRSIFKLPSRINTNYQKGYEETVVTKNDIFLFHEFLEKVPYDLLKLIPYLDGYDPYVVHGFR